MNVIINASAAKYGGAREIIQRYVTSLSRDKSECTFFLICPNAKSLLPDQSKNIVPINFETRGLWTYLFSIGFVYFFVLKFNASKVISFNNVNLLLPCFEKVTYFHQEKAISGKGLRFLLLRAALRFNKRQRVVVQSDRIGCRLHEEIGIPISSIDTKWPGVRKVNIRDRSNALNILRSKFPEFSRFSNDVIFVLFPVYTPQAEHKDFVFFKTLKEKLARFHVCTISLCPANSEIADIDLGKVDPSVMDVLYSISDGMIISSISETLCLPLFEYIQTGRKIICRSAPFILDFKARYSAWMKGVSIFHPNEKFDWIGGDFFASPAINFKGPDNFISGEWGI